MSKYAFNGKMSIPYNLLGIVQQNKNLSLIRKMQNITSEILLGGMNAMKLLAQPHWAPRATAMVSGPGFILQRKGFRKRAVGALSGTANPEALSGNRVHFEYCSGRSKVHQVLITSKLKK